MKLDFTYDQLPAHVVFGSGAFDKLEAEAARLKLEKVLVLSTPGQQKLAAAAAERLRGRCAGKTRRCLPGNPQTIMSDTT